MSVRALALPGLEPGLAASLQTGLDAVEDFLQARVNHDDPFLAEAGGHLLAAGGSPTRRSRRPRPWS